MTKEETLRLEELTEKLSMKERLFVTHYEANGWNATEACRQAGYVTKYPNKLGSQIAARKTVKEYLQLRQKVVIEDLAISPEYVIKKLVKTVERAETEGNHNATLRGLELIARHLGMFVERTEISGRDGEAIQYEKVQNDATDFARTISSLAKRGGAGRVSSDSLN